MCANKYKKSWRPRGKMTANFRVKNLLYIIVSIHINEIIRFFCPYSSGDQLQAIVVLSQKTSRTRGYLQLSLQHGKNFTSFQLYCE